MQVKMLEKHLGISSEELCKIESQSEAKDLLIRTSDFFKAMCTQKQKHRFKQHRMDQSSYYFLWEIYKSLRLADYKDALGVLFRTLRSDSLRSTVLCEAIYKALTAI